MFVSPFLWCIRGLEYFILNYYSYTPFSYRVGGELTYTEWHNSDNYRHNIDGPSHVWFNDHWCWMSATNAVTIFCHLPIMQIYILYRYRTAREEPPQDTNCPAYVPTFGAPVSQSSQPILSAPYQTLRRNPLRVILMIRA